MSRTSQQPELFSVAGQAARSTTSNVELQITLDLAEGCFRFDWTDGDPPRLLARGMLEPINLALWSNVVLSWRLDIVGQRAQEHRNLAAHHTSVGAFIRQIRKRFPVLDSAVGAHVVPPGDWGELQAGMIYPLKMPQGAHVWKWLGGEVLFLARVAEAESELCGGDEEVLRRRAAMDRTVSGGQHQFHRRAPHDPTWRIPAPLCPGAGFRLGRIAVALA